MTRDDIRKLIGGYATGSLSESERKTLFEAALDDQELFDELAQEQALKELLDEPGARQRLISALTPQRETAWSRKPLPRLAVAGALALAAVITSVELRRPPARQELAQARIPELREAAPVAEPVAKSAPPPIATPARPKPAPEMRAVPPPPPAVQDSAANVAQTDQLKTAEAPKMQVPAAAPVPRPAQPSPRALGALGGAGGGGGGARLQQFSAGVQGGAVARFAFDYSVTPEGLLRIVPSANGFLTVIVNTATVNGQVLISGQPTQAASVVEVPLPAESIMATIFYSAQNAPAAAVSTGALSAEDPPSGTKIDPAPSPNSRLQAVIPLTPRE